MAYSRAAIRAPAPARPAHDDDNLDSDEEREERMLSELHGEAGDDTAGMEAPSGKRKRQALTASTEEDAAASAEFEEKMRKKRAAARPALDASHLKGSKGLITVRRSFPSQVRKFRHVTPPAAAANRSSKNPRSAAIAARLATKSTLDAAASYSSSLMSAYDNFARTIFPSLAAADVFLKIESLGSKKEVKDYLQVMRDDMRREYLVGVLGRERTDRILHELEYGMRASVSLRDGPPDVRRGDLRGRDELEEGGGVAPRVGARGGGSDDDEDAPSGAPRERAANPYATRAGVEPSQTAEASEATEGSDEPNDKAQEDEENAGEEDDEAEAEATFDDVAPTQTARSGDGEDDGDDEMAEAAKDSSSDALRMMMTAGEGEAPAASEEDVGNEPEDDDEKAPEEEVEKEPEEEPARASDAKEANVAAPPSSEPAQEEEYVAGNEVAEEEEKGTQETLTLVPGTETQEGEKGDGTQETLTLVPGEGGATQETLTLVPGDDGGTQETLTMAATQFAEADFTQDGDDGERFSQADNTQASRFSQTQGGGLTGGGTQDDDDRFSQTQDDDGLTQDDGGAFGMLRDREPLVMEEVEQEGGDGGDEEGAGGDRLGQTMDTQISQEY